MTDNFLLNHYVKKLCEQIVEFVYIAFILLRMLNEITDILSFP